MPSKSHISRFSHMLVMASFSRAYKRFFGDTPRAPAKSGDTSLPLASVGEKGNP